MHQYEFIFNNKNYLILQNQYCFSSIFGLIEKKIMGMNLSKMSVIDCYHVSALNSKYFLSIIFHMLHPVVYHSHNSRSSFIIVEMNSRTTFTLLQITILHTKKLHKLHSFVYKRCKTKQTNAMLHIYQVTLQ